MKKLRPNTTFFLFLSIFFVSAISYPKFFPKDKEATFDRFALENPSMCAPFNDISSDFGNMRTPLAPKLNYKWDHNFPITTKSPEAQQFFNQGLFYTYAFNHAEAKRSFKEAIRLDPDCAMAYWGTALVLGPNINRPMEKEAFADAWCFSQRAMELREKCTPKEQALIEALAVRYEENPPGNRSELDLAYANAMRIVAHRYREDVDILTLFAEALMDTMPWDYWGKDGSPKYATQEMHATLDYVLVKDPNHPGANHYYIHSVEALRPEIAEHCADKLKEIEYAAGHLVHMPSHIYIRLGRYADSNRSNQRAIELDEDYIEQCQAQGFYPALYYPHNVHFLWFGASMEGSSAMALEAARKTAAKGGPGSQRFKVTPLYTMLRFGKWEEILKQPEPEASDAYIRLVWHYAKGMAFAKTGKLKEAENQLSMVGKSKDAEEIEKLNNPFFPSLGMSEICYLLLAGEIAGMNKNFDKKVNLLRQAVEIQDGFTYMEPPFFYFQVRQALGAALLQAKKPAEAETIYREELNKFPDNGWSLYGLHQSLQAQGKEAEAQKVYEAFEKAWVRADIKIKGSVI